MSYEMYPGLGDPNIAINKGDTGDTGITGYSGPTGERGDDFNGSATLYNVTGSPSGMLDYRHSDSASKNNIVYYVLETSIKCGILSLVSVTILCRRDINIANIVDPSFFNLKNKPNAQIYYTDVNGRTIVIQPDGLCQYICNVPTPSMDTGIAHSFSYYTYT